MHAEGLPFSNRADAGRRLAERLDRWRDRHDIVVLALPRGGVPVAFEIARRLRAPLDVFVVRKLGVPGEPELAMGAIASGGIEVLNPAVVGPLGIGREEIDRVADAERRELERRELAYRAGRAAVPLTNRTVILVDDGIATGSTVLAACQAIRSMRPERLIVAAPVAPPEARSRLVGVADEFVCVAEPAGFFAISTYYEDFEQTSDEEVRDLLGRAAGSEAPTEPEGQGRSHPPGAAMSDPLSRSLEIPVDGEAIAADVSVPNACMGVVVFAHGSGSSRFSPRNRVVAAALAAGGFATVLADLLTESESVIDERTAGPRFDIALLAGRVATVLDAVSTEPALGGLPIGLFGASTGAAAALVAAAQRPALVSAVVSRGGRPDLAGAALPSVRAPVLLVVGGRDTQVLQLNREALARLQCEASLHVVPGATHLFEESGALEEVTNVALAWFRRHLARHPGSPG